MVALVQMVAVMAEVSMTAVSVVEPPLTAPAVVCLKHHCLNHLFQCRMAPDGAGQPFRPGQ